METRIKALASLREFLLGEQELWRAASLRAIAKNAWFTEAHINLAVNRICDQFLDPSRLQQWLQHYPQAATPKTVGIVMAGNIPLVGFHDFLCVYLSGHRAQLKLSSKDDVLLPAILEQLSYWDANLKQQIHVVDRLENCDAFIATGSNNSARYFEYYFGKKPHIIRRNRTSVALLDGTETTQELEKLGTDVFDYFGLGCRNVTQVWVPEDYNFETLLQVFSRYDYLMDHNKYKNNYDYHLALYLLNLVPYKTNGSILIVESPVPFSAVSVLHYCTYKNYEEALEQLKRNDDLQCIIGKQALPFGSSQSPALDSYADGVDTMQFLSAL